MKKTILSLMGAAMTCTTFAANCVSVKQISTDYANHQIILAITRSGCTGDGYSSLHRNTVWVFVDYRTVTGATKGAWTRATIGATSAGTVVNSGSSKGAWIYGTNGTQTVTLTLSGMPAKYDWCAFATDYPPNATNTNGGIYALKGSKPLVINGATSVTGDTYSGMINTLTDATGCPGMIQYNFSYTGSAQSITLTAGTYDMECWGAQGTNGGYNRGGYGGYVKGTIDFTASQQLFTCVGGQQSAFNANTAGTLWGGGASDIRLVGGGWNDGASLRARIVVAGGGGGGAHTGDAYAQTSVNNNLTAAGGLVGYSTGRTNDNDGGTQTTAGRVVVSTNWGRAYPGGFGYGGYSEWVASGNGGGGYYGGGGGTPTGPGNDGVGSGGSSFISGHNGCNAVNAGGAHTGQANHYSGRVFTNTVMIDGGGYSWTTARGAQVRMPNPSGGSYSLGAGNSGNGYVRITRIK